MRTNQGNVLLDVLLVVFSGVLFLAVSLAPDPGPRSIEAIEVEMGSSPVYHTRNIPRPRPRPGRIKPATVDAVVPAPCPRQIPSCGLVEQADLSVPRLDAIGEIGDVGVPDAVGDLAFTASAAAEGFMNKSDYLELLKMRVDSLKIYPAAARVLGKQGRVLVRFTIDEAGSIQEAALIRGCGTSVLDRAALHAVRSAAPFPMAPAGIFVYPLTLQIEICFELT